MRFFIVIFILSVICPLLLDIYVDWSWFTAVEHTELFTVRLQTQVVLWVASFVLTWFFVYWNLNTVVKSKKIRLDRLIDQMEISVDEQTVREWLEKLPLLVSLFPAWLIAQLSSNQWLYALAFWDRETFDNQDVVFGNDVGYYVFQYPMLSFVQGISTQVVFLTLLLVGVFGFFRDVFLEEGKLGIDASTRKQGLLLGGMYFLLFGWGWYLERYETLFEKNGVVWGAGYTDINAQIPSYYVMMIISIAIGGYIFAQRKNEGWGGVGTAVVAYIGLNFLLTNLWPSMIQKLMVKPNELEYERDYITENIKSTREAFALDRIQVQPFNASTDLSMSDVESNPLTINNVRVWDDRPLLTTYSQIQEIRTYYDFVDVDVDRYLINGELRQVMLAARELNTGNLPSKGRSWINDHLQYTHGYGLTMSPVNVVTEEGLPELFIQDIPPVSSVDIEVSRPEIYYGEITNNYVVVGCTEPEFDYPEGDVNVSTKYQGDGGVPVGGFLGKIIYSSYFGDSELLLSQSITKDSKILMYRDIQTRLKKLAPFLQFDQNPYMVLSEGRLFWIADAYTTTKNFPYSESIQIRNGNRYTRYNYIRNSVKIVIDAYHGNVKFYISDESDPLIKVYSKIFSNSFEPLSNMPTDLQNHVRYPVDFFDVQAWMYRTYHMMDPTVFYNNEDMWNIPKEKYEGKERTMESYYLIMKLPEAEKAEFVLLLPFAPAGKDNMISWLAARSDGDDYGKLILYQFPKQKLIYGPRQIEARIDQDPDISQEITLWSTSGSRVVRGNLLVIPIEDSLVYVEPLYLQAESSQLPELKRIIVSYDKKIAMEKTLGASLAKVFGVDMAQYTKLTVESQSKTENKNDESFLGNTVQQTDSVGNKQSLSELIQMAVNLFERSQSQQREGNWAGYGDSMNELQRVLQKLDAVELSTKTNFNELPSEEEKNESVPSQEMETTP